MIGIMDIKKKVVPILLSKRGHEVKITEEVLKEAASGGYKL